MNKKTNRVPAKVKLWGVMDDEGIIMLAFDSYSGAKRLAIVEGDRVIRVLVTPLPSRGKKKK